MNLPVNDDAEEGAADPTAGPPFAAENQPSRGAGPPPPAARSRVNRRTLDEVFGDVLPSTTRDERDESPDEAARDSNERWYRDNRPPHHG